MRWAKVPEWLPDALVAVPKPDRHNVAPGTALAGYVALALRANFRTGEVNCTPVDLAGALDVTPRSARRTLALLEHVGAVHRDHDGRLWVLVDRADLQVHPPATADLQVRAPDLEVRQTDLQVRAVEHVVPGQVPDLAHPLRTEFLSEQDERFAEEGLRAVPTTPGEQMELSPQRSPRVDEWLARKDDRLRAPMVEDGLA